MKCATCERRARVVLCVTCEQRVLIALRDAPALYVRAHASLNVRSQQQHERVKTSRPASRSPLRDDLLHLADELARTLATWESFAVAQGHLPSSSPYVRWGVIVQRAAATLAEHVDDAVRHPSGPTASTQVVTLVGRLRYALGETRLVHRLAAPCPHCDTRALVRRDGDDHVECSMCRSSWPEKHYQLLVRMLVEDPKAARALAHKDDTRTPRG